MRIEVAIGGVLQKLQGHNLVTLPSRGTRAISDLSGDQLTTAVLRVCMGSSSNVGGASTSVGGASTSTAPPEQSALIDLYQRLHGSTGDSSSKDTGDSSSKASSGEEMESLDTLTHIALPSDDDLHEYAEALLSSVASNSNSMDVS